MMILSHFSKLIRNKNAYTADLQQMKLFYYENFFFLSKLWLNYTIFCKLIFTKKKSENASLFLQNTQRNIALCIDRIEIYCKPNRRGINHKRLRRFMVCQDRKKADYPRPSLWIYTPSISLNLATYFTLSMDQIHRDQILKQDKLIKKGVTCQCNWTCLSKFTG